MKSLLMKENDNMENVKLEDIENIRIDIETIEKFPVFNKSNTVFLFNTSKSLVK